MLLTARWPRFPPGFSAVTWDSRRCGLTQVSVQNRREPWPLGPQPLMLSVQPTISARSPPRRSQRPARLDCLISVARTMPLTTDRYCLLSLDLCP